MVKLALMALFREMKCYVVMTPDKTVITHNFCHRRCQGKQTGRPIEKRFSMGKFCWLLSNVNEPLIVDRSLSPVAGYIGVSRTSNWGGMKPFDRYCSDSMMLTSQQWLFHYYFTLVIPFPPSRDSKNKNCVIRGDPRKAKSRSKMKSNFP